MGEDDRGTNHKHTRGRTNESAFGDGGGAWEDTGTGDAMDAGDGGYALRLRMKADPNIPCAATRP